MDLLAAFLFFLIGIILFALARTFKDYPTGILSGLYNLVFGVIILINPISDLANLSNLLLGSVLFGFGAYVFIRGSIEFINEQDN